MSKLIDIHNHVLPIDDGAQDYRDSLRMLQDAVESNISTVFVSPHIIPNGKYCPTIEFILDEVNKLKEMAKDIPIEIKYGSEFQVNADSLPFIENKQYLCYENTDYLLVEFSRSSLYHGLIEDALDELSSHGVKVIIAHPERYFETVEEAVSKCKRWIKHGYYIQVNRTSLIKGNHPLQRKIGYNLLLEDCVHLIASDAHRVSNPRRLVLLDVFNKIKLLFGRQFTELIFHTNTSNLVLNKELRSTKSINTGYKLVQRLVVRLFS
jgi:protein-tyrosine phosphatase